MGNKHTSWLQNIIVFCNQFCNLKKHINHIVIFKVTKLQDFSGINIFFYER